MIEWFEKYEVFTSYIELIVEITFLCFVLKEFKMTRKSFQWQEEEQKENERRKMNKKFSDICVYFYNLIILYQRECIKGFKNKGLLNDGKKHTLEEYMTEYWKLEKQGDNFDERELKKKFYNENLQQMQKYILTDYEFNFKITFDNEREIIKKIFLFCINDETAIFYAYNDNAIDVKKSLERLILEPNKTESFLKKNNCEKEINKIYNKISVSRVGFSIFLPKELYDN